MVDVYVNPAAGCVNTGTRHYIYMDDLAALRLQLEWGVDEILLDLPQDRRLPKAVSAPEIPALSRAAKVPVAALPANPGQAAQTATAAQDFAALRAALARLDCPLRDTATSLVFGDGAEDARIVMIGDAPGPEEDRSGIAFSGPAGQLLDKMLASISLSRAQIRLLNIIPWRPPGDRAVTESEIALCKPFLERHVALVNPDCVILLGAVAAKAMLPAQDTNAGISRLRGKWRKLTLTGGRPDIDCLPMYHPAYLLRMPSAKRDAWNDLLALRAWIAGKNPAL
jgi:DNA polymerase